jgi:DNA polymerase III delta prime subunit
MGYLDQIKEGKMKEPLFILIYGVPGVGKTTLASEAPKPLFLGDANESSLFNVSRLESKSFQDLKSTLQEILDSKELLFKTLILDNLGWLEPLIWKSVCKEENKKTIDDIGYGRGYKKAVSFHDEVITILKEIRQKHRVNVVVLAHSKVKTFQDPTIQAAYDQYQMSVNEEVSNVWIRSVDAVLFMNYEVLKKDDKDKFAQGEGIRFMYTQERPSFKAKNRFGLPFRMVIPMGEGWKVLTEAINKGEPESAESLLSEIEGLKPQIQGDELRQKIEKVVVDAGKDVKKLLAIKDRMISVIGGSK